MERDLQLTERGRAGKLKKAARLYAGGQFIDDTDDALAFFGLQCEKEVDQEFKIYDLNWPTFRVFMAVWPQLRKDRLIGWSDAESAMRILRIKPSRREGVMDGLLAMQEEIYQYWAEQT